MKVKVSRQITKRSKRQKSASVKRGAKLRKNGGASTRKGLKVSKKKGGGASGKGSKKSGGYVKQSSSSSRCTLYCAKHPISKTLVAQFNPTKLPFAYGANFAEITSPGMNYPVFQFVGGKSTKFNIELYFHDIPFTGSIGNDRKWLRKLVPPRNNKKKVFDPPVVDFKCGYFTCKFVTEDMSVEDELLDTKGRPLITRITLSVILVGSTTQFK